MSDLQQMKCPDPFLEVRVSDTSLNPSLLALCAGYESGEWRAHQFASHLIEWLPEFCLKYSEIEGIGSHNMVKLLRMAASNVYDTEKFKSRGEIGELILHAITRQEFHTLPLISKIFYKDSPNDTVKGFDCVHILENDDELELWLGEVKFYQDFKSASRDVCAELELHSHSIYLRKEFIAICNKLDDRHPASQKVASLLNQNTSLDKIFPRIVFPVLITYESDTIKTNTSLCTELVEGIQKETGDNYKHFKEKIPNLKSIVHLIMVPLEQKKRLINAFDNEIRRLK